MMTRPFVIGPPIRLGDEIVEQVVCPLNLRRQILSPTFRLDVALQSLPNVVDGRHRERPQSVNQRVRLRGRFTEPSESTSLVDDDQDERLNQIWLSRGKGCDQRAMSVVSGRGLLVCRCVTHRIKEWHWRLALSHEAFPDDNNRRE